MAYVNTWVELVRPYSRAFGPIIFMLIICVGVRRIYLSLQSQDRLKYVKLDFDKSGIVSVEFTLLLAVLMVPIWLVTIEVAPTFDTWITDLRDSIVEGQVILDALEEAL